MPSNHSQPLPSLTRTEIRRLESRLEKDIRRADLGSLDRLIAIVNLSEREKCAISPRLRFDALKMFCSKLSLREYLVEAISIPRAEFIILFLEGIMTYSCPDCILNGDNRFKAKIGSLIAENWAKIIRLVTFLVDVQLESDLYDRERAIYIKIFLANFFIAASVYTFSLPDIVSSNDALRIIIKLWLEDTEEGVEDLSKMLHASFYIGGMSEDRIKFIQEIVPHPRQIAQTAMTRLRKAIRLKNSKEVCLHLDVVSPFFLEGSPTLLKELVRYRGIPVIMSIADQPGINIPGVLLGKCIHCVAKVLMATSRLSWLKTALDEGFMEHFIKFSTTDWEEDYPNSELIRKGVFAILRSYLVFSPAPPLILESISECLQDPNHSAALSSVLNNRDRRGEWSIFEENLLERFIIRQLILDRHKYKIYTCSNYLCEKTGKGDLFKRCESCLTTYYCSKACQRTAWSNHKQKCKDQGINRRSVEEAGIPHQREQFLYYTACYDVMRHSTELQKLFSEKLNDVPPKYQGIRISYSADTLNNVLDVLDSRQVVESDEVIEEIDDPEIEAIPVLGHGPQASQNNPDISTDSESPISLFVYTATKNGEGVFLRYTMPRIMLKVNPDATPIESRTFYSDEPPKPLGASYGEVEELVQQVRELSSSLAGESSSPLFSWDEDMIRSVVARYLEGHHVSEEVSIA